MQRVNHAGRNENRKDVTLSRMGLQIDLTLVDEQFCRTAVRLIALTAAELVLGIVLDTANGADETPRSPRWLFWRGLLYAASARSSDRSVPLHEFVSFVATPAL